MSAQVVSKTLILSLFVAILALVTPFSTYAAQNCTPYSVEYVSNANTTTVVGGGAAVPTFTSSLWTPAFNGASWVWASEYVDNPEDGEVKVFQTSFSLPGDVESATLLVSADDYFVGSANGTQFASEFGEGNFLPQNVFEYSLQNLLQKGENTLEFEVTNAKYFFTGEATAELNPAGLLFKITVNGTTCADTSSQASVGGGKAGSGPVHSGFPISSSASAAPPVGQGSASAGQVMSAHTEEASETPVLGVGITSTTSHTADQRNDSWLPCFFKALLLVLLVVGLWLVMRALAKRHSKRAAAVVVDAELVLYALASIIIIFVLWLMGAFCILPFFVLGMLIVMVWRMFVTRSK